MKTDIETLNSYYSFKSDSNWQGSATELADIATDFGEKLGIIDAKKALTERLVRDYVRRGIIDRPTRVAKDAVYNTRHLDQLLEARQLINSGIKLQALPALVRSNEVQDLRLKESSFTEFDDFDHIDSSSTMKAFKSIAVQYDDSLQIASQELQAYEQLKDLNHQLWGSTEDFEKVSQELYKLAPGIELVINQRNLKGLTDEQIALITQACELLIKQARDSGKT